MAVIETNADILLLIEDKKKNGDREAFVEFMRERKALMDEKGKTIAEDELVTKYKDEIDAIKAK